MKKIIVSSFVIITAFAFVLFAQNFSVDISKVPNGTYLGKFTSGGKPGRAGFVYEVSVKVTNGKLISITPITMPNHKKTENRAVASFSKMVSANKVDIDATTKATFKGVVHNALTTRTPYNK